MVDQAAGILAEARHPGRHKPAKDHRCERGREADRGQEAEEDGLPLDPAAERASLPALQLATAQLDDRLGSVSDHGSFRCGTHSHATDHLPIGRFSNLPTRK